MTRLTDSNFSELETMVQQSVIDMSEISERLELNLILSKQTSDNLCKLQKEISEVTTAFKHAKGFIAVVNFCGNIAKPVVLVSVAAAGLYAFFISFRAFLQSLGK